MRLWRRKTNTKKPMTNLGKLTNQMQDAYEKRREEAPMITLPEPKELNTYIIKAEIYRLKDGAYESCRLTLQLPPASDIWKKEHYLSASFAGRVGELEKYCREVLKIEPTLHNL